MSLFEIIADGEVYVVVSERDLNKRFLKEHPEHSDWAIVFEAEIAGATLEKAKKVRQRLGDEYGATRIAKLIFLDESEI